MLQLVDFCGFKVTRLIIGANPFGGFSHQNGERDRLMREYYTVERIKQTWARAEAAGINTMITNNETPHVLQAVREYLGDGGALQWIAQINPGGRADMSRAIGEAVEIGCRAAYFHGALVDELYRTRDEQSLRSWCAAARAHGVPIGVAAHAPAAHRWVDSLDVVDFHAVCFFNCGSLHDGQGEKFRLGDVVPAAQTVRAIAKPCIGYKIMGAGRIDARMAFEFAFENIKPHDVVNVGMFRGENDDMVEENVAMVREILAES
ncbi:MAG: hypothetical protein GF331_08505 [Chitinivibrionales bacterium]|nr:hypothetical protein [Chitinivibrionales bacterium]